jgi:hypothetical protein
VFLWCKYGHLNYECSVFLACVNERQETCDIRRRRKVMWCALQPPCTVRQFPPSIDLTPQ